MLLKTRHPLLILTFTLLTACGGGGGSGDESPTNTAPTVETSPGTSSGTTPEAVDPITRALVAGEASYITDIRTLIDRIISELNQLKTQQRSTVKSIFGEDSITFAPGNRNQLFNITRLESTYPLIVGNDGRYLAVAGETSARYAAFGEGVLNGLQNGDYPEMTTPVKQLLAWLLKSDMAQINQPRNIALSYFGWLESDSKNWLTAQADQWQFTTCSDSSKLNSCYDDKELIIISWNDSDDSDASATRTALQAAIAKGTPVLYIHDWYEAYNEVAYAVADLLGTSLQYGGNYWANSSANWVSSEQMLTQENLYDTLLSPLEHLRDRDFSFDWSGCISSIGKVGCGNVSGINEAFFNGAQKFKASLNSLDQKGTTLFSEEENRLLKLMVLLGDKLRESIRYPMDKVTTDTTDFMSAYFADHLAYYNRTINPAQADLGNFSENLSSGNVLVPQQTVSLTSNGHNGYTGTGLYVMPGQTIKVTRTDSVDTNVTLFINTQRTGSTREFNSNQYQRPKFLKSPSMILAPQQPLTLTSPYGGPLMVYLSATGTPQTITFTVEQSTHYPYLTDLSQASSFVDELRSSSLNWAGIKTDFIEINSRKNKMLTFIDSAPYNGNVQTAMDDVWVYMVQGTYNLAGFQGNGLSMDAEVNNFCTNKGWNCDDKTIHAKPQRQHINVDEAAHCGGGCSGNPYDQSWALTPLGWGESHEIGHNLQRGRLKIYSSRSTEVSNNIFPAYKGWQYFKDNGTQVGSCSRGGAHAAFDILQAGAKAANPTSYVKNALWSQTGTYDMAGERLAFYIQMAFAANQLGSLDHGWQLFTLIYLHDRLLSDALKSDSDWQNEKIKLGFGNYDSRPTSLSAEDFMLISHSLITDTDQRPFYDMWGIEYSSDASAQVIALGLTNTANKVFYMLDTHCQFTNTTLPVDGNQTWP